MLTLKELRDTLNVINFIEYASINYKIKTLLEWRKKTVYKEPMPRNNAINFHKILIKRLTEPLQKSSITYVNNEMKKRILDWTPSLSLNPSVSITPSIKTFILNIYTSEHYTNDFIPIASFLKWGQNI